MKPFTSLCIASALVVYTVSAQQQYQIDPTSVPNSTRQAWCTNQLTQCPLICLQAPTNSATTESNQCDPNALTYSCVCGNGQSPNISEYTQTLPYYICTEWGTQCVANCGSDSNCASNCRSQHPCGAQNPTRVNTSTIASSTLSASGSGAPAGATTGSQGTIFTGFAGASASSTSGSSSGSKSGAQRVRVAALNAGQTFGMLGLVGALFGGFAILL